jgi:hypothetical protein
LKPSPLKALNSPIIVPLLRLIRNQVLLFRQRGWQGRNADHVIANDSDRVNKALVNRFFHEKKTASRMNLPAELVTMGVILDIPQRRRRRSHSALYRRRGSSSSWPEVALHRKIAESTL